MKRLVSICVAAGLLAPLNVARGENLIRDGASFEAGLDGCALAIAQGRLHRECAQVRLEIDRTTAVDGACSLKFSQPADCQNRYGLYYKPVALRSGKAYAVSRVKRQKERRF